MPSKSGIVKFACAGGRQHARRQGAIYRNSGNHIAKDLPRKAAPKSGTLDPLKLPPELQTRGFTPALRSLRRRPSILWRQAGIETPPVFIVVCTTPPRAQLVHEWIAGLDRYEKKARSGTSIRGISRSSQLRHLRQRLPRPATLLIDSEQLRIRRSARSAVPRHGRSGDRAVQGREMRERGNSGKPKRSTIQGPPARGDEHGRKEGRFGEQIRCVVSVAMLTEGWDTNTVTHVLGVPRLWNTSLLCEQVVGAHSPAILRTE